MADYILRFFRAQLSLLLTVDLLRKLLTGLVESAKTKAEGTENPFDDAFVAAVEWLLADDARMEEILWYLRAKIGSAPNGECETAAHYDTEEALAVGLAAANRSDGECESTAAITVLAEVLKVLIPALISVLSGGDK